MELSEQQQGKRDDSEIEKVQESGEVKRLPSADSKDDTHIGPGDDTAVILSRKSEIIEEVKKPSEDRISTLSDGIFAIAVTLLVLNIQIPLPDNSTNENAFMSILTGTFSNQTQHYLITFAVLAAYWFNHRNLMNGIKRVNPIFIWLNLLFLAFVAFFPVVSNLLHYTQFPEAVIIYTVVLAGCGYSSLLLWIYAFGNGLFGTGEAASNVRKAGILGSAISPTFFLLSLLLLLLPPFKLNYVSSSWLHLPRFAPGDIFYCWLLLPIVAIVTRRLGFFGNVRRSSAATKSEHNTFDKPREPHS